jgi:FkbH-like protein
MLPAEKSSQLRSAADRHLEAGQPALAAARLGELWRCQRDLATASFINSRYERLHGQLPLVAHRTSILRSFTVEPIVPLLRAEAFCAGIDLSVQLGDFNAYSQEILDSGSKLYASPLDSVILAVRAPDIAPDLWAQFTDLPHDDIKKACARVGSTFRQLIAAFRERSQAALIVHSLEQPVRPNAGILDAQSGNGQTEAIRQINRELRRCANENRGVYLLDYDALRDRHGRDAWQDDRKYLTTRLPISGNNLIHMAQEWLRFLVPISGKVSKALVVDLDNTLWGGIIGEDGLAGIKLGAEYPGAAYQALQRAILDLTRRGILLAICSKNNPEDAMEVLEKHPDMLLRPQHFAALRITWNDKTQGLREIAAELNIGIDALAFLDDNPVEREQVRVSLPEVTVIELPDNPLAYAATLRDCPVFERLSQSEEDQRRSEVYASQRERARQEQQFQSKEDFYRFLEQTVEIAPLTPETLARIAQLTQKTNQFNLTTRRYTEPQLSELNTRNDWQILSLRVRDRFGDQGLVGVSITHDRENTCEIDTLLLSCRVIGRTVETAFLSALAQEARSRGCTRLSGCFLPTRKNVPARDFYFQHGFQQESDNSSGTQWTLDLTRNPVLCPDWIVLKFSHEIRNTTNDGVNR